MLADLPSGHVFHTRALYVKIILDVINYFAGREKERARGTDRDTEREEKRERSWQTWAKMYYRSFTGLRIRL